MPTAEKVAAVADYKKLFEESDSFFVTDYQGLTVADMTVLRKDLRDNQIKYLIAKNTLLSLAAAEAGVEGIDEFLIGPTAIAFSNDDPAVTAKILHDSFKARKLPAMKAFWLERKQFDATEIKRLADLPSRELLLSGVVAAIEAPFTSLVGSFDGFFRKLVGTIDALAEKRKEEGN
ncbi:MAG: 50S ribosomal protein L10 [candidate division Zixibacteria bacterium]|nr:50S ribosomal protein L10 [candidate division Zixibacteria bacterium]